MLYHLKPRSGWIAGAAHAAALMLIVVLVGCGGSDQKSERVAVRSQKRSQPATAVTPPPSPPPAPVIPAEPEVTPTPEPPVTYEVAEAAYMERRYGDAAGLFERYTEEKGENPWGFYMLGLSYWKSGNDVGAEGAFVRALELDPNHVKSHLNLGRVLLDMHRPTEALAQIDMAIALDSESSDAYRLRGRALRQEGRTSEAIAAYRRAIQIDDTDAWSMNNLALIYIEQGRFSEALPPIARAIELDAASPVFFNNLGMALEGTGRFRDAEVAYRSAVDIDKSYFKAGINMDRVALVIEDPGVESVDLEVLAGRFVETIRSWPQEVAVNEGHVASAPEMIATESGTGADAQVAVGEEVEPVERETTVIDSLGTE